MRVVRLLLFCLISLKAQADVVDVKLNYQYAQPERPNDEDHFCLEFSSKSETESERILRNACAQAAKLKGFSISHNEKSCKKIKLSWKVDGDGRGRNYEKEFEFHFFLKGGDSPSLKANAWFLSDNDNVNRHSMIAACRSVFNYFPSESKSFNQSAKTTLSQSGIFDFLGVEEDLLKEEGTGPYVLAEAVFNGGGLTAGYYFYDRWAAEAGAFNLTNSGAMDAANIDRFFARARLFPFGKFNVTFGPAYQVVYFSDHKSSERINVPYDPNSPPGKKTRSGSIHTIGLEGSVGYHFLGGWKRAGLIFGVDFLGVYAPHKVVRSNVRLTNGTAYQEYKTTSQAEKESVLYVGRFSLGYAF